MTEIIWSSERSWEQAERGDWGLCIRLCTKQLSAANPFLPFIMVFPVCSVHTGWDVIARASCECSVINTAAQARKWSRCAGSQPTWRCTALEELSEVKLLRGEWRTAPNPSKPAFCIVAVDIDADDQPERDPQQGH